MSTWSGWVDEFLTAARIINTPPNQRFMSEWASHANSPNCRRNPVDLHYGMGSSTNCVKPAGRDFWTQNYATHGDAAAAFAHQVNSTRFGAILDTLGSGNPFQDPGYKQVVAALNDWSSSLFAQWYLDQVQSSSGGGGGGSSTSAPHTHTGWHDLRRTVNRKLPHAIAQQVRLQRAALRSLGRGHKVRL